MQARLFPLEVIRTDPPTQGADISEIATAENGLTYYVKHPIKTPGVPLTEWICNHLAHEIGLPTVGIDQLKLRDGTIAFGSRREANAQSLPDDPLGRLALAPQFINAVTNPHIYSACYVFDLFVSNNDRHPGNYLYQAFDNQIVIRVIDFSRSFPARELLPINDLINSNTGKAFQCISSLRPSDRSAMNATIDKIAKIPLSTVEQLIESAHPTWVNQESQTDLLFFWALERDKRLQQIATFLP